MKALYSSVKRIILVLMAMVVLFVTTSNTAFAYASEMKATNVLDDLMIDSSFDVATYPAIAEDYSLQVIHVAESVDNELYVYVYHPSGQARFLPATYLRLSLNGIIDNVDDYLLTLVSREGVFAKYLVNGVTVGNERSRVYDVICIYRNWVKGIDEEPGGDNTVSAVPFNVSKRFYFNTDEYGIVTTTTCDIKTVEITEKFVGYILYPQGLQLPYYATGSCTSYFFAFGTDLPIERIQKATVKFKQYYYSETATPIIDGYPAIISTNKSGTTSKEVVLTELDKGYSNDGIFYPNYEWWRIDTVADFLARPEVSYTEEELKNFAGKKWILRFYEGSLFQRTEYGAQLTNREVIEDVSLIQLEFVLDGVTYNTGVIDNYQTGSDKPVGTVKGCSFGWKEVIFLIIILVLVVLVVAFGPRFLIWLLEFILNVIWWLIKVLWWIISAPFKWIFGKSKDDKDEKGGGRW